MKSRGRHHDRKPFRKSERRSTFSYEKYTLFKSTRTRIKSLIPVKFACNYFSVCRELSLWANEKQMQIPNDRGTIKNISQSCWLDCYAKQFIHVRKDFLRGKQIKTMMSWGQMLDQINIPCAFQPSHEETVCTLKIKL